ncbi:hypothetical protein WKW80_02445 [Variovorax humicola]|uniref:Lipoprotein n=1 Tax=Variovorax humicola TaxID=1769758 RepID=A0ABU8VSZ6_9BURK
MKRIAFGWAIPLSMALTTTLLVTGCGGGGGGGGFIPSVATTPSGSTPSGNMPSGNMTSGNMTSGDAPSDGVQAADPYAGFITYVMALLGSSPETGEPADVAKFDPPPTSETKDPVSTP